jgi:hypothetical protein
VPLKNKTGKSVASAFLSIFSSDSPRYAKPAKRRPVLLRTDRGKEFVNDTFQKALRGEGIEFGVCRNHDVKCSVVERAHRTLRDRMYKYFTHYNKFRFIDNLPKFVKAYNDSVHISTGLAPARVTDKHVLQIWRRATKRQNRIPMAKPKFSAGQHVRISKEKMKFAKGSEQNFSTEIFKIVKVIRRIPRPLYELQDLNGTPIDGAFYQEELVPVRISKRTVFKIHKILSKRVRKGTREVLVSWRGYPSSFNSWIPASNVKNIK